jgi:RNA polymerase sigma-70 factor, ECF subfamily
VANDVFQRKMIDEEGLAAALADDLDAHFERLVRVYQDRLYGFALRLTRSPQDAEESTQDAFVRAYRALDNYDVEQRRTLLLKPWLYRITLNVVRNRVRRPSLNLVYVDGELTDRVAGSWLDQPEAITEAVERHRELERLVAELPPRYGTAVVLRHVQGLSYAEASEVLGQPVGTTKSDVHRGLRLLREALGDREPLLAGRR